MFDKNWTRAIIAALAVFIGIFYIESLDSRIKILNIEVAKLSNLSNEIGKAEVRVDEIIRMGNASEISETRAKEILKDLNTKLISSDINLTDNFFDKNLEEMYGLIQSEAKLVIVEKNKKIEKIREILRKRKLSFRLIIFLTTLTVVLEIIFFIRNSKRVQRYLDNLSYKKYDFKVKEGISPFQNTHLRKIDNLRKDLKVLDKAIKVTLKGYGVQEVIKEIFYNEEFKKYLKFDRIGFAVIMGEMIVAEVSYSETNNIELGRGFSINLNESKSLQKIIETKDVRVLNDLEEYYKKNSESNSTKLILQEGFKSSLTAPIIGENEEVIAFLFFSSKEKNSFNIIDKERITSITDILSYIISKHMLIDDLITNTAFSFVKLVEGKDPETSNHIERMALYSKIIAQRLQQRSKYSKEVDFLFVESLYKFAPLHDIGKVGIPDNILLKPEKLTVEEFEIMKGHSIIGAKVLSGFDNNLRQYERNFFNTAIKIAIGHHEKWDGTGYPNGLATDNIPLEARIVSVADVFDALASKRVYKEALPFNECIEIIKQLSGSSFDPEIVDAFLESKKKILGVYNRLKEV